MNVTSKERVTHRVRVKPRHPYHPDQTGEQLPIRAPFSEGGHEQVWVRLDSGQVTVFFPWDLEDIEC